MRKGFSRRVSPGEGALTLLYRMQQLGWTVAMVDLGGNYALPGNGVDYGIDTVRLLISTPETEEQALEIADALARSGAVAALVLVGMPSNTTADAAVRQLHPVAKRYGCQCWVV
jgi:RecA/RadA recombinase